MDADRSSQVRVLLRQIKWASGELAKGIRNNIAPKATDTERKQTVDPYLEMLGSTQTQINEMIKEEPSIDSILGLLEKILSEFYDLPHIELSEEEQKEIDGPFKQLLDVDGRLKTGL